MLRDAGLGDHPAEVRTERLSVALDPEFAQDTHGHLLLSDIIMCQDVCEGVQQFLAGLGLSPGDQCSETGVMGTRGRQVGLVAGWSRS